MKIRSKIGKICGFTLVELASVLPPVGLIGLIVPSVFFGEKFSRMGQGPGDVVVEVRPIDQNATSVEGPGDPVVVVDQNTTTWEPTVQGMKEARSWPLSPEAKVFVGRWKESDPDFPNDHPFEVIWREDHSFSSLALFADENGKIEERILTHGLWVRVGDKRGHGVSS